MHKEQTPVTDVLYRIKRGLSGYVSYLAACEMNQAFSEYVLYEPVLRILMSQGFDVKCEVKCPGLENTGPGDKKRIDFVAKKEKDHFAMEVKWAKTIKQKIDGDMQKLREFHKAFPSSLSFLCVFGRKSIVEAFDYSGHNLKPRGVVTIADFGRTRFACRIFQLIENDA